MKKIGLIFALLAALALSLCFPACKKNAGKLCVYKMDCVFDGANTLDCTLDFTYYNDTDTSVKELKFNIFPNAYRQGAKFSPVSVADTAKAFYDGVNYGGITINSVADKDGGVDFAVCGEDENILAVPLSSEVFPEDTAKITIKFTVKLAKVNHRLGITKNAVNLGNFYPILCAYDSDTGFYECVYYSSGDPFYSSVADYDITLTVPENYSVASSGKIKSAKTGGGTASARYVLEKARDFAFVLSDKFESVTGKSGNVTVDYYFYSDEKPEDNLAYAVKAVETFSKTFGACPYSRLSVVQTGFVEGGMEYPGLVYISDALEPAAFGEVIVHETAHQWWYAGVGNNQVKYGFLDEGLAEYSVVLFYEKHPEYGLTRDVMMKSAEQTYRTYCTVYDKLFGKVDTSMLRSLGEYASEYEYVNIAYIKACIMYDCLRQSVGDKRFFGGLEKYYSEYKYKIAEPQDLVGVFERLGADSNGFFDSFFTGKAII